MSKQKKLILEIIKNSEIHLTAEEIYNEAKKQIPSISLGTVYRNLGSLADELEVKKVKTPQGKFIYDKSIKPHGHEICPGCGRVIDYNSNDVNEVLKRDFGDRLISYDFVLNAFCDECLKNNKKKGEI